MFGEEKCGCYVVHVELDELEIQYCPKHKAAPDLHKVIRNITKLPYYDDLPAPIRYAIEKALAKAEGK